MIVGFQVVGIDLLSIVNEQCREMAAVNGKPNYSPRKAYVGMDIAPTEGVSKHLDKLVKAFIHMAAVAMR